MKQTIISTITFSFKKCTPGNGGMKNKLEIQIIFHINSFASIFAPGNVNKRNLH